MPIASPAVVADTHTLIWFLINGFSSGRDVGANPTSHCAGYA